MESENEQCLAEWKQIEEQMQFRIAELESQEKIPDNNSVVSEQENVILQLRAELESLKETNERLDGRLKKAQADIKEQQ